MKLCLKKGGQTTSSVLLSHSQYCFYAWRHTPHTYTLQAEGDQRGAVLAADRGIGIREVERGAPAGASRARREKAGGQCIKNGSHMSPTADR